MKSSILSSAASPMVFFRTCRPCRGRAHMISVPQTAPATRPCLGLIRYHPSGVNALSTTYRNANAVSPNASDSEPECERSKQNIE